MNLVREEIEHYCTDHSTLPSRHCEAIARYTYENVPDPQMLSGNLVGSFLGLMVTTARARRILEVGCYTGYSALAMAERLPEDGELITLDINPETTAIASRFWKESPHGKKIRPLVGDALTLIKSLSPSFDLVFIDAHKPDYARYAERILPLLGPTGVIIADNCLWSGRVADPAQTDAQTVGIRKFNDWVHANPRLESTLIPIRDGLHVVHLHL